MIKQAALAFPSQEVQCLESVLALWSAAGFVQWGYAMEKEKGSFIAWQLNIYQVGSVIGSIVAFALIYKGASTDQGAPVGVYIAFLVFMCGSLAVAFLLVHPSTVLHPDGRPVAVFKSLTFLEEVKGIGSVLKDCRVLFMIPVIFT